MPDAPWTPHDERPPAPALAGSRLLAVDLGLRTGLAVFLRHASGVRLLSYRSQNYGSPARLKRGARGTIGDVPELAALALEGDAQLARAWAAPAERRGAEVMLCQAERWRASLLSPRDRRSGAEAKRAADRLARAIIAASTAPAPTSLRHDAAEAICLGWWAAAALGWREPEPPLVPSRRG